MLARILSADTSPAIAEALTLLGYNKTYHMKEVFMRGDYPFWIAAMDAKYEGKGKRFGLEEFDEFLGEYMVSIPAAVDFVPQKTKPGIVS